MYSVTTPIKPHNIDSAVNPLSAFAERHAPRRKAAKTKHRAKLPIKKADDAGALSAHYRRATEHRAANMLATPGGEQLVALLADFTVYGVADADDMIARVAEATWLLEADANFRFFALRHIDDIIRNIRKKAGLREFDDPLPGEPDNAFLRIKRLLGVK